MSDCNEALKSFNENFDDGTAGNGDYSNNHNNYNNNPDNHSNSDEGKGHCNYPKKPAVEDIDGENTICKETTTIFKNETKGGVWSSDKEDIAKIDGTGKLVTHNEGTATIKYSVTNVCGTTEKTVVVKVKKCDGVESGDHGGLESKSLGDAVGNRIF